MPFEKVPFQFSAHRIKPDGSVEHFSEFLADGNVDPRREFVIKLIDSIPASKEPIVVWNAGGAEVPVLLALISKFPEFAFQLQDIVDRIIDLAIVFRKSVLLRQMISKKSLVGGGLFSLKNVAPACAEGFGYDDLTCVTQGNEAVEAYYQLVTGEFPHGIDRQRLRDSMLEY